MNQRIPFLAFAILAITAAPAFAEVSQRDQQRAAQRAYEQAARTHEEVQRGWEAAREAAQITRDAARAILERAVRPR